MISLILQPFLIAAQQKQLDVIVLGCTHFPLIKEEINEYYNGKVVLIDSPTIVAQKVYEELKKHKMLSNSDTPWVWVSLGKAYW